MEEIKHRPDYILGRIAFFWKQTDLQNLRDTYRNLMTAEDSRKIPIILSESQVFVQLSMRNMDRNAKKRRAEQGYISLKDYDTHFTNDAGTVTIQFKNSDVTLECSSRAESINRQVQRAKEFRNNYMLRMEQYRKAAAENQLNADEKAGKKQLEYHELPPEITTGLTPFQHQLYRHVQQRPDITYKELRPLMNCTHREVADALAVLKEQNLLYRVGSCRYGYWEQPPWVKELLR